MSGKRPENVRCENCCYFIVGEAKTYQPPGVRYNVTEVHRMGTCHREPPTGQPDTPESPGWPQFRETMEHLWCGEFRDSWPSPGRCHHALAVCYRCGVKTLGWTEVTPAVFEENTPDPPFAGHHRMILCDHCAEEREKDIGRD